ncbi:MAG: hypothetical protein PHS54_04030 [Clostridia bacterium]|nr:hypothetical protein [Clostridia bacterium]
MSKSAVGLPKEIIGLKGIQKLNYKPNSLNSAMERDKSPLYIVAIWCKQANLNFI